MLIGRPEIRASAEGAVYAAAVKGSSHAAELLFRVPMRHADHLSDSGDAAAVALLIPAMETGEDLIIRGRIATSLHFHLSGPYQDLLQRMLPNLKKVAIRAEHVEDTASSGTAVMTGLSGGIDSFSALATHHYARGIADGFRLTMVNYNDVGSHGTTEAASELFARRLNRIRPLAERLGLPLVPVTSNVTEFYRNFRYEATHTPRSASVPLLLSRQVSRFFYASTYDLRHIRVAPTYDMAFADPIALSMLGTNRVKLMSADMAMTRVEKVLRVAEIPDAWEFLDVCTVNTRGRFHNCGTCSKCKAVLATLEIAGMDERFERVFDIGAYRTVRDEHFRHLLRDQTPLSVEIVDFARERGYPIGGSPGEIRSAASEAACTSQPTPLALAHSGQ